MPLHAEVCNHIPSSSTPLYKREASELTNPAQVFPNSVMGIGWLANNLGRCLQFERLSTIANINTAPHYVRATGTGIQIGNFNHCQDLIQVKTLTITQAIANCAAFVATFIYLTKDAYVSRLPKTLTAEILRFHPARSTFWVTQST